MPIVSIGGPVRTRTAVSPKNDGDASHSLANLSGPYQKLQSCASSTVELWMLGSRYACDHWN